MKQIIVKFRPGFFILAMLGTVATQPGWQPLMWKIIVAIGYVTFPFVTPLFFW
jgi:hypothetical protein